MFLHSRLNQFKSSQIRVEKHMHVLGVHQEIQSRESAKHMRLGAWPHHPKQSEQEVLVNKVIQVLLNSVSIVRGQLRTQEEYKLFSGLLY